jgi:hypothetical protein
MTGNALSGYEATKLVEGSGASRQVGYKQPVYRREETSDEVHCHIMDQSVAVNLLTYPLQILAFSDKIIRRVNPLLVAYWAKSFTK